MSELKAEYSTDEAFEVIIDLLKEPGETNQPQLEYIENKGEEDTYTTLRNFFSFRSLISSQIIEVLYIIGAVGIVVVSWNVFMRERLLVGILSIIVGNLVWRLACETVITLYRMNEKLNQLGLIHQVLKRNVK